MLRGMRAFHLKFLPVLTLLGTASVLQAGQAKTAATYRNPIMPERELADPHVINVDGKYYLYPTSTTRGYEAFVSEDLVRWELKGRVFNDPRGGNWAPDVFQNRRGDGRLVSRDTDRPVPALNQSPKRSPKEESAR